MNLIEISEITKRFAGTIAVNSISLNIKEGEIFGLLGPNGAGKSTLINLICGLLIPQKGRIIIDGLDLKNEQMLIKPLLGLVPQDLAIYRDLTAMDNVKFFGSLYGFRGKKLLEAAEEALESTGLSDHSKKRPETFSGGMKRRLNIACGIVHKPKLIIFDEPTVGIDPQSRNHILETIKCLNRSGSTIIYTTHYIEEAELLCSKIAIIDHGKVIAQGNIDELKTLVNDKNRLIIDTRQDASHLLKDLLKIQGVSEVNHVDNQLHIGNQRDVDNLGHIVGVLHKNNINVSNIINKSPNLEMVFLSLTGRSLRD